MNPLTIKGNSHKVWSAVREEFDAKQDGECLLCGEKPKNLVIHHKNGNGLDNRIENLIAICPKCHIGLHQNGEKNKSPTKPKIYYSEDPDIRKLQEIKDWYSR